ncbi:MAG: hypothetical protein U1C96_10650, partial [Gallionella sp.]|nr:hypothetical protein [Methylobacter sp.]MDP3056386.1 hypothetical protein [Methylobacter sp.]MDP3361989.1 hypothetical protein [Methylobacter sp.]MDZ4202587.1 hypothetical protein [Gallionella sp.]
LEQAMGAAFGAANGFTQHPNTLFANFANLSDNASASRAYSLCRSVFLSLTNDTDIPWLVLRFVPF